MVAGTQISNPKKVLPSSCRPVLVLFRLSAPTAFRPYCISAVRVCGGAEASGALLSVAGVDLDVVVIVAKMSDVVAAIQSRGVGRRSKMVEKEKFRKQNI